LADQELTSRINLHASQHRGVLRDLIRFHAAPKDDGTRLGREFQRLLSLDHDTALRGDPIGGSRNVCGPPSTAQAVEQRGGHERVKFVEGIKRQNRDPHAPAPYWLD
jgi:hypothetical protein